ncbi:MAG: type II toxin-antitoxin system Phd/YefM family antitoxin [Chloroflexi bacterium]|nr:type II toxin-antitoxin system Phd/YefM family antitoxin [Chloroflexota bacterium]
MDTFYGHDEQSVPAGEFKQRCLALLDRVAETGMPIVVTKRGVPVARVVPIESPNDVFSESVRVLTDDEEELYSTGITWDAEHAE